MSSSRRNSSRRKALSISSRRRPSRQSAKKSAKKLARNIRQRKSTKSSKKTSKKRRQPDFNEDDDSSSTSEESEDSFVESDDEESSSRESDVEYGSSSSSSYYSDVDQSDEHVIANDLALKDDAALARYLQRQELQAASRLNPDIESFSPGGRYNLRSRHHVQAERRSSRRYNLRDTRGDPRRRLAAAATAAGLVPWSNLNDDMELIKSSAHTTLPDGGDLLAATVPSQQTHQSDLYAVESAPGNIPRRLTFDSIAGMEEQVRRLKEMVILPLLYPDLLSGMGIKAPRGVLFHGPPGTGKTLLARILADRCTEILQKRTAAGGIDEGSKPKAVSFFLRNGSDCLSKWIGEAERNLRQLFVEAKTKQPAIIFFDELDGLAPDRAGKQSDQSHISLVATLLALMDGLDDRGQVVVIGATNRPDALDPALRRPGRFDREFEFFLPGEDARARILEINTATWPHPPPRDLLQSVAAKTEGWSGADLAGLCTEAALLAIQRTFPNIYNDQTDEQQQVECSAQAVHVTEADFGEALAGMCPSTGRKKKPLIPTVTLDTCLPMHVGHLFHAVMHSDQLFMHSKEPLLVTTAMGLRQAGDIIEAVLREDKPDAKIVRNSLNTEDDEQGEFLETTVKNRLSSS